MDPMGIDPMPLGKPTYFHMFFPKVLPCSSHQLELQDRLPWRQNLLSLNEHVVKTMHFWSKVSTDSQKKTPPHTTSTHLYHLYWNFQGHVGINWNGSELIWVLPKHWKTPCIVEATGLPELVFPCHQGPPKDVRHPSPISFLLYIPWTGPYLQGIPKWEWYGWRKFGSFEWITMCQIPPGLDESLLVSKGLRRVGWLHFKILIPPHLKEVIVTTSMTSRVKFGKMCKTGCHNPTTFISCFNWQTEGFFRDEMFSGKNVFDLGIPWRSASRRPFHGARRMDMLASLPPTKHLREKIIQIEVNLVEQPPKKKKPEPIASKIEILLNSCSHSDWKWLNCASTDWAIRIWFGHPTTNPGSIIYQWNLAKMLLKRSS